MAGHLDGFAAMALTRPVHVGTGAGLSYGRLVFAASGSLDVAARLHWPYSLFSFGPLRC